MKCKVAVPILAIAMAGALLAQGATATHVHPHAATPLYVPLVVAYKTCVTPNSNHLGGILAGSCVPPTQESNFLTVGTPDANGAAANSAGFVRLVARTTTPEDVLITSNLTDVRCKPATDAAVCNSPNQLDGPDYSGPVQVIFVMRVTDHWNGASGTDTGTVIDFPFPINESCVNTASTSVGSTCSANTTMNAILPFAFTDNKRSNAEVTTVQINDGGASGVAGAPDETRFATQGIFIP
jgi:hypothetical protein